MDDDILGVSNNCIESVRLSPPHSLPAVYQTKYTACLDKARAHRIDPEIYWDIGLRRDALHPLGLNGQSWDISETRLSKFVSVPE